MKIKNRSLLPVLAGRAALSAVNLMTEEAEDTAVSFSTGPHKTKEIQIRLTEFRCGCIKISAGAATVSDPLEIFEKNRTYRAQAEYYALPAVNDLEISKEELSKYDMESYKYSSVKKGEDLSETFSIRAVSYTHLDVYKRQLPLFTTKDKRPGREARSFVS